MWFTECGSLQPLPATNQSPTSSMSPFLGGTSSQGCYHGQALGQGILPVLPHDIFITSLAEALLALCYRKGKSGFRGL